MKLLLQTCFFMTIFWEIYSNSLRRSLLGCPKNMNSFLVNNNSTEQFCDCEDTFWYYPKDDACYDGYRQGPCPSGHYFVLSPGEPIAKCEKNPCNIDGFVPFEGECYQLWDSGVPCKDNKTFLGINDDFQITCSKGQYLGYYWSWRTSKDCPENSYLKLTNGDHNAYFCECKMTYIFSRIDNSCHQAYRQGPCAPENYFVLPLGETEPICEKNPCREDGIVPFQNDCYRLFKTGPPCADIYTTLTVNTTTFQLECSNQSSSGGYPSAGGIINAPLKACPPGSRRIVTGCKKVFE